MLSALCWVPKGVFRPDPRRYEPTREEVDRLIAMQAELSLDDAAAAAEEPDIGAAAQQIDEEDEDTKTIARQFNMETYDEEEDGVAMFLGGSNLMYHQASSDDPYITLAPAGSDDDISDEEDNTVQPTDAVFLLGRTEEEASSLEIHVYEDETGNLYVHHDIALPAFPLALAWLNVNPAGTDEEKAAGGGTAFGNIAAVGMFDPGIELWDLDMLDPLEPIAVLGGTYPIEHTSKKGKRRTKSVLKPDSHTDAVMCLGWHPARRSILASGSADTSVKLWDITTQQCFVTLRHHGNKVQSMEWNPAEPNVLLSGGYDQRVAVVDVRQPQAQPEEQATAAHYYPVDGDIECVRWNPSNPALFVASSESGAVICQDVRRPGAPPLFTIGAHRKATSSLSFNSQMPNVLATASLDKSVKVWDLSNNHPSCICSKDMNIGQLHCMSFFSESAYLLAAGGDKGTIAVWNMESELSAVRAGNGMQVEEAEGMVEEKKEAPAQAKAGMGKARKKGTVGKKKAVKLKPKTKSKRQ